MNITPFLMFEGRCEEAMNFYVSLFGEARIDSVTRYGPEGPGKPGTVMHASFTLLGRAFQCIDSAVAHGFTFTPAISLMVDCEQARRSMRSARNCRKAARP